MSRRLAKLYLEQKMAENQNNPERGIPPGTPGWVKVFFIIILVLAVIVVVVHLLGFRFDHGAGVVMLAGVIDALNLTQGVLV
jgi:hypothetical protein